MKKLLYLTIFITLLAPCFGQIGIGTTSPNSKAALELSSTNKGFLPAKVPLISTIDPAPLGTSTNPPIEGLLVYNTIKLNDVVRGYYIWQNGKWELIGNQDIEVVIDQVPAYEIDFLGYAPVGMSGAPENSSLTYAGTTLTKKGNCQKWASSDGGNDHIYCAYENTGAAINWAQAFNLAKVSKGYLVTITSDAEWDFILNNVINPNNLNGPI